jgi:cell shape-determining protein MreC
MEQILEISHAILLIGWALSMVLLICILIWVLVLIIKTHLILNAIKDKIEMIQNLILMPLEYITTFVHTILTKKDTNRQNKTEKNDELEDKVR